jgi:predicted glutamine amidotransferase
MCGIVYVEHYLHSASKAVAKRYQHQKNRGTEGFGYVAINPAKCKIESVRRRESEKEILAELEECKAQAILFHHRFPTSTPNLKEASHPITVKNARLKYVYYVVHNGIISNDDALKAIHEGLGYQYTTAIKKQVKYETMKTNYSSEYTMFNDSEALAIELAEYIEGKKDSVDAEGSMAFIVLQADQRGNVLNLYYGRNRQNPLKLQQDDAIFSLTSEGGREDVEPNTMFCYNYKSRLITKAPLALANSFAYQGNYGGYQGKMGFRTADDWDDMPDAGAPVGSDWTLADYREGEPMSDWSVENLLSTGWTPDDIVEAIDEELYLLEEISRSAEARGDKKELAEAESLIRKLNRMSEEAQNVIDGALSTE